VPGFSFTLIFAIITHMNDLIKRLEKLITDTQDLKSKISLDQKEQRILELEAAMQAEGFWNDNESAQHITQEYNHVKTFFDFWTNLEKNSLELLGLIKSEKQDAEESKDYLEKQVEDLEKQYNENRLVLLLSKKYDDHNAVFSIHAGAGGTDAQDWADMLLRMIMRYCEKKSFKTDVIELSKGSEAGLKSVTVQVHGQFAYGLLKSEAGVHRLVRLSPYNPAHTRETSFALLELIPLLEESEAVTLDPKDIEIEATTSSGHGGQSVNTTYSAIRITHKPTGLKVSIQNERSQHQNKEIALKILTAKVQAVEDEKTAKEKKELRGEYKSAEWGNQIRSYVLHPYKLIKDHRTDFESTDPDSVLNGDLDDFVEKYLEWTVQS
jgi:peptide chain release factor 2